jgi:hypothetical protein
MEAINSHLKMPLGVDQNSLTLMQVSVNGGSAHSQEENNGFGKLEFSTEETVVVVDSREPKSALEDKNVERLLQTLKMANGMRSNVVNHSEVTKLFLRLQEEIISQFLELKFTLQSAQEVDAEVCHQR